MIDSMEFRGFDELQQNMERMGREIGAKGMDKMVRAARACSRRQ